jgi:hypothetical protein
MKITLGKIGRHPWIAEIIGTHPKYGLGRKFLFGVRDYSRANSTGSRGIATTYDLAEGVLYEISDPASWARTERYFAVVKGGNLESVDAATALERAAALDQATETSGQTR